jgi:hypothetical protein
MFFILIWCIFKGVGLEFILVLIERVGKEFGISVYKIGVYRCISWRYKATEYNINEGELGGCFCSWCEIYRFWWIINNGGNK